MFNYQRLPNLIGLVIQDLRISKESSAKRCVLFRFDPWKTTVIQGKIIVNMFFLFPVIEVLQIQDV